MAEWNAPLPPNDVEAGDPGHPAMHNELVDAIYEIRENVDDIELTPGPEGPEGPQGPAGPAGADGATEASELTVEPIDGIAGTDAQAVFEELAARLDALESD